MIVNIIIKTIIQVILISTFIGVFFFTYASKIEENIVKKQCSEIVQDLSDTAKVILPSNIVQDINSTLVPEIKMPDLSKQDEEVKIKNGILLRQVAVLIAIFMTVGIIIVTIMIIVFKVPVREILISSFISVIFVGIVEYSFLTFFAQNYRTIDSNFVKMKIIENVIKNVN